MQQYSRKYKFQVNRAEPSLALIKKSGALSAASSYIDGQNTTLPLTECGGHELTEVSYCVYRCAHAECHSVAAMLLIHTGSRETVHSFTLSYEKYL